MKQIFFTFTAGLFFIFALTNVVHAQSQDQTVKKYGIVFPIAELGNCNNIATCKVYCDQPENKDACIAFAKSKGFYKETVDESQVTTLSFAKAELGCNSVNSCKTFCQQETNLAKCQAFAQKHELSTSKRKDEELFAKAKQNLNCDSFESCRSLCDQQENYVKCAALLQDQVTSDDRAMFEKYKPQIKEFLGCDSIVTCMAFCINPLNTAKCAELGSKIGSSEVPNQEPPEVWCPNISSECKWDGTNCVCNGPQTCSQSNETPGCTWDGTQCNCPGTNTEEPPEVWCPKAGLGCAWDGNQCVCQTTTTESYQDNPLQPTSEPGIETGASQATPEPGEVWCPRNPSCKWTGETCLCEPVLAPQTQEPTPQPAVQGVKTTQGLIQQFLNFIYRMTLN